jgi:hypothetical protein
MSLRKSPARTPAFLAANRANAAKSTGPRTPAGKRASAMNALRHGERSRSALTGAPRTPGEWEEFDALRQALGMAVWIGDTDFARRYLLERTIEFWKTKRAFEHWLETHPWGIFRPVWPLPAQFGMPPLRTTILTRPGDANCPGWKVRVSFRVRWGRSPPRVSPSGPARDSAGAAFAAWRTRRRRLHVVVVITCIGHPWTQSHRQRLRTSPEYHRRGLAWKSAFKGLDADSDDSGGLAASSAKQNQPGLGSQAFGANQ